MADLFINNKATEGRYGFGTTESVDALLRHIRTVDKNMSVMAAINVDTLIRNAVGGKTDKADEVVLKVRKSMNEIASEIAGVCHDRWKDRQHHVLYYMIHCDRILPQNYRRPKNMRTENGPTTWFVIDSATQIFLRDVKPGDQTVGNCSAHLRINTNFMKPSYKGLLEIVNSMSTLEDELQLISHYPMDYHVAVGTGRNAWLYRSHTGDTLQMTPGTLGKIVFKNEYVPFYPKLHVLLGDKYAIKPALMPSDKKKLLQLAEQGRWSLHTNTYVSAKIKENSFVLPYEI